MICNSTCATDLLAHPAVECETDPREGGIDRLVFMTCDEEFADITDLAEWTTKIAANDVHMSPPIMGSKPKGSFTKKKLRSCGIERVIAGAKQIDFKDYSVDDTNFDEFKFWNLIQNNSKNFQLAYVGCDGLFRGFITNFEIEVDDEIEEDAETGNTFISGSVFWNQKDMIVPVKIVGFDTIVG